MKKFLTLLAALMLSANIANAQLSKVLGSVVSSVSSATGNNNGILSAIGSIISSKLIPTEDQIVGTWSYQEPAVMFTSQDILKSTASAAISKTIENRLQSYLTKVGMAAGNMSMTFEKDKTFTVNRKGKKVASGTYEITGNEVTLTFKGRKEPCKVTPQLDNGTLVVVMDATKLKVFFEGIGSNISQLSTIVSLMKTMDGMKIGIRMAKQ